MFSLWVKVSRLRKLVHLCLHTRAEMATMDPNSRTYRIAASTTAPKKCDKKLINPAFRRTNSWEESTIDCTQDHSLYHLLIETGGRQDHKARCAAEEADRKHRQGGWAIIQCRNSYLPLLTLVLGIYTANLLIWLLSHRGSIWREGEA